MLRFHLILISPLLIAICGCASTTKSDLAIANIRIENSKVWNHPTPITYQVLRAWHKEGGLQPYPFPKERHLDLKGDGSKEVFLGIAGYSRGMTYALFTKTKGGWVLISDQIEGNNRPFELLPATHGSWHDFLTVLPSWRGKGCFEFVYTWNGKGYVQKLFREVADSELSRP